MSIISLSVDLAILRGLIKNIASQMKFFTCMIFSSVKLFHLYDFFICMTFSSVCFFHLYDFFICMTFSSVWLFLAYEFCVWILRMNFAYEFCVWILRMNFAYEFCVWVLRMNFHLWIFICEFSSVSFHLWVFICEFSSVSFHLWVFIYGFLSVSFHLWIFICGFFFCEVIVDSLNKSRLKSVRFLVEKSDVSMTNDVSYKIKSFIEFIIIIIITENHHLFDWNWFI
jgi:hypothetical protein